MAIPRCTLTPLPDYQVAFLVNGRERLRWHFGPQYPRPFFYPFIGPGSGQSLTRIGHPGAPNHDHHRSIWFAHHKVLGMDFWADGTPTRIRQLEWLAYEDGETEAAMAVKIGWFDGHDPKPILVQELIAAIIPIENDETLLELQTTFVPTAQTLEFGQTNFGFLAVRVAKELSVFFGGGTLTNSQGQVGEPAIFGKPATWMDYSGERITGVFEGITFFDHPSNPGHPAAWHVREDGWMGASANLTGPRSISQTEPLRLRYLLHAHRGLCRAAREDAVFESFAKRSPLALVKAPAKHTAWGIRRV